MNHSVPAATAAKMCEALKLQNYTVKELATMSGLTKGMVDRWLSHVRHPLVRIAYIETWRSGSDDLGAVAAYRWGKELDALQT